MSEGRPPSRIVRRAQRRARRAADRIRPSATKEALGDWSPERGYRFREELAVGLGAHPCLVGDPASIMAQSMEQAGVFWVPADHHDHLRRTGSFHAQDLLTTGFTEGLAVLERPLPIGLTAPVSPATAAGTVRRYLRAAAWSVWGDRITVLGLTFCDNQSPQLDEVLNELGITRHSPTAALNRYPASPWYPTSQFWTPATASFPVLRIRQREDQATALVLRHVAQAGTAHREARLRLEPGSEPAASHLRQATSPDTTAIQRVYLTPYVGDPAHERPVATGQGVAVVRPYTRRQHVGPGRAQEKIVRVAGHTRGGALPAARHETVHIVQAPTSL